MSKIIPPLVIVLLAAIPATSIWAHWDTSNKTFPWAMPGQVRWLIDYSKMQESHVKLMLDAQFNLLQGGSFTPEALELARSTPGVHTMQYICSRTIYHEKLFKTNPELKDAAILSSDQSYKIIYSNPARYAGCYNREAWLNYIKARMDDIHARGVDAIFFDNPMTWACYCPTCQELFRQYSRQKTGQELKLGQSGDKAETLTRSKGGNELENWFAVDTAQRFFEKVHAYAREKGMFIVANNLTYWLVDKEVTDGVFSEAGGHPPFFRDIAAYKIGLAASHGKPTGILDYIPGKVRQARGKQVFNHSRGSGQKWVGAPVAEEFEIGYAQGLACGGNYIANYSLELGRHVPEMANPEDQRIQAAMVKYGRFAKSHPEIYGAAHPGSPIAVLYSLTAGPREGHILGVNRAGTNELLWTLIHGGVPAEVIVEDDLTPERLAGFRAVIVDTVAVLEPQAAEGLAQFAQAGGTVVLADAGKVRGRYESKDKAKPLSAYFPGLPQMDSFIYDATDLELDGYEVEATRLKVSKTGRATATFPGHAGRYRISISYLDESDGQGHFELEVDGKRIGEWENNMDDDRWHTYVSPGVELRPGAKVTVVGHSGGGEYGRIMRMKISTDLGTGDVAQFSFGRGVVLRLTSPLTNCAPEDRDKVLGSLRPMCPVGAGAEPWPESLLINLTKATPRGPLCVHLVNYDFSYDDKYVLQGINPTGPVSLRVHGAETARLFSPDGQEQTLKSTDGIVEVPPVRIYSVVVLE